MRIVDLLRTLSESACISGTQRDTKEEYTDAARSEQLRAKHDENTFLSTVVHLKAILNAHPSPPIRARGSNEVRNFSSNQVSAQTHVTCSRRHDLCRTLAKREMLEIRLLGDWKGPGSSLGSLRMLKSGISKLVPSLSDETGKLTRVNLGCYGKSWRHRTKGSTDGQDT